MESPKTETDGPAMATHRLKEFMTYFQPVLASARASGRNFPQYATWIDKLASAIAHGMKPSDIETYDPYTSPNSEIGQLNKAAQAAQDELADFLPPLPGGHDLETIGALMEGTRPKQMSKALLANFATKSPSARAATANLLTSEYKIP